MIYFLPFFNVDFFIQKCGGGGQTPGFLSPAGSNEWRFCCAEGCIYYIWFSQVLIILQNNAAQLLAANNFPVSLKSKAVYFVKRQRGPVPKEDISQYIIFGDMAVKPIEQLAALVDEASVHIRAEKRFLNIIIKLIYSFH